MPITETVPTPTVRATASTPWSAMKWRLSTGRGCQFGCPLGSD